MGRAREQTSRPWLCTHGHAAAVLVLRHQRWMWSFSSGEIRLSHAVFACGMDRASALCLATTNSINTFWCELRVSYTWLFIVLP